MSLYAYCLCRDELAADALAAVVGVAGGAAELLCCGRLWAVVSEFTSEALAVTRDNVLAHERVCGRVLTQTTPLPFRFGTLTSAARLRSYVATHEGALLAQLERVRECVEMSVKVIWRGVEKEDDAATASAQTGVGVGTAFLAAKRRALVGDERRQARAAEIARWLAAELSDVVRETHVRVRPAGEIVLAAAHLVERARLEDYRARLRQTFAARGELHFLTSGPWPPYSFSEASPSTVSANNP